MFKGKKKKKSKSKTDGEEADGGGAEFDPTLKKKKKKKVSKEKAEGEFDAALAEAGVVPRSGGEGEEDSGQQEPADATPEDTGDLLLGTGVWNAASTVDLTYPLLLTRFFTLLRSQHPDLAGEGRRSYKIPPPQVLREGNKKTIFANISDICKRMKRFDEHVTQFLFAELGTSGSVDGSKRLVIRGKFQQKQLENVLRRYICNLSSISVIGPSNNQYSGIRHLQNLQVSRHGAEKGRKPSLFRHLQQLWVETFSRVRTTSYPCLSSLTFLTPYKTVRSRLVSRRRSARGADSKHRQVQCFGFISFRFVRAFIFFLAFHLLSFSLLFLDNGDDEDEKNVY